MDFSTIIEGNVKFRDGKKWKSRWCVMRKLSPVADCLHLQLYRDSRDRYKQGLTKASLSLQHFLGLETGFTLDKESNTVAIICHDLTVVLAFDTRERLIQWQVKIYTHLGEDEQYLIQISSSPPKAKLSAGPAKLHIQEHRFCLTIGVPPKLVGNWEIKHLRRFGVVDGRFCFEGGSLCGRGEGLYVFLTDQAEEITHHVQLAADGKLKTCKRPLLKNLTVAECESPRKSLTLKNESHRMTSEMVNENINDGSVIGVGDHDVRRWPSIDTQVDRYGHADTSSLADFPIDSQNGKVCNWGLENQLMGRCVSCVGKLGLISRCSTAANTPGSMNFNPWSNDDSKLYGMREEELADELNCRCNTSYAASVSHKSKYSDRSSSGGRTEYSEDHSCCSHSHSSMENISKNSTCLAPHSSPPPKNFAFSNATLPCNAPRRPPKPQKYRNLVPHEKKINKAPMPLPNDVDNDENVKPQTCKDHDYDYDSPPKNQNEITHNLCKQNTCPNASQFYDTPRNIKRAVNESYSNYDVPPSVIHHVYDDCLCAAKTRLSMLGDDGSFHDKCLCGELLRCPPVWFQLPVHHYQCKNHWPNVKPGEKIGSMGANNAPVYAQVDLSKKLKNRLTKEAAAAAAGVAVVPPHNCENGAGDDNSCYESIRFDGEAVNYDRLANLNYMNLEFTNSFRYYENVGELMKNTTNDSSRIESLNIDLPANSSSTVGACCRTDACRRCEQSRVSSGRPRNAAVERTAAALETNFENYVPMSPLKSAAARHLAAADVSGGGGQNLAVETLSLDRRIASGKVTPMMMMMKMMMMITTTTTTTTYAAVATATAATANSTTTTTTTASTTASSAAAIAIAATTASPASASNEKYSTLKATGVSALNGGRTGAIMDARKRSNSLECSSPSDGPSCRHAHAPPANVSLGDSDSGLESDKPSQENDDTVDNLRRRKGNQLLGLRRFASNGYKAANANRDSSSSNDSGFSSASFKYSDFEMPLTTATSAERHHSFNQHCRKNGCTVPRRSKSSDPLRDLTFHFHKDVASAAKSSSAEAELPLCLNRRDRCKDCPSPADTTISTPYVDCRSTSSGTSDMSDYIETLSLSSHSSADVHSSEAVKLHQSVVTTLKPRSGVEYQKIDRSSLLNAQSNVNP
ncbi:uncharacterized protein LOC135842242 isoform X2 [Planococcus citri]|uniref:uncharacterized protein LOC135842242 isoform X2 n=1 Tax=Planococcus citri TaxID=170843 RepID=UPI0031F8FEB1